MKTLASSLFMSLSMLAVGCGGGSGNDLGSIEGFIVNQSGEPVRSARVVLNDATGLSATTDENGMFQLTGVDTGRQMVHAIDYVGFAAGSAEVNVSGEQPAFVGELMVRGCNESADGNGRPEPCAWDWPAPASRQVQLGSPSFDYIDGVIQGHGVNLSAHDFDTSIAYLTIDVLGSFMTGGSATVQLEPLANGGRPDFGIVLHYTDENGMHEYWADGGSITVDVTGSDVDSKSVSLRGSNLSFSLFNWNTFSSDPSYKATISSLSIDTVATVMLPPVPPTENISLGSNKLQLDVANFHVSEDYMSLHLYDYTRGFSGYIDMPASLLSLPGSTSVTKDNQIGFSRVELANDTSSEWTFRLEQMTITTTASKLEMCKPVSLTIENASFRYDGWEYNADGYQVPVPSDIMLTIDRLDVTTMPQPDGGCPL